jgi:hypothetical protein
MGVLRREAVCVYLVGLKCCCVGCFKNLSESLSNVQ